MMKLLPQHKKAVDRVLPVLEDAGFYLAGGTAVYYYLRHRESYDLDFHPVKNKLPRISIALSSRRYAVSKRRYHTYRNRRDRDVFFSLSL